MIDSILSFWRVFPAIWLHLVNIFCPKKRLNFKDHEFILNYSFQLDTKKKPRLSSELCALGRIRTLNPQSRNLIFYPVELRVRITIYFASSTACTFSAASFNVIADCTFKPDSSMILAPSSALVP